MGMNFHEDAAWNPSIITENECNRNRVVKEENEKIRRK